MSSKAKTRKKTKAKPVDAPANSVAIHEAVIIRGDGKPVKVTVSRDEAPEVPAPKPKRSAGAKAPKGQKAGVKKTKPAKAAKAPKPKRVSLLDAAAAVLVEAKAPMNVKAIIERVAARALWAPSRGGKTPHASLYAAMTREIAAKGKASRFTKIERGLFTAGKGA